MLTIGLIILAVAGLAMAWWAYWCGLAEYASRLDGEVE